MDTRDRRGQDRMSVAWNATIEAGDDRYQAQVCNVSDGGVLVRCSAPVCIGREVVLIIDALGEFAAEVRWQKESYLGLKLVAGYDLLLTAQAERAPHPSRKLQHRRPRVFKREQEPEDTSSTD